MPLRALTVLACVGVLAPCPLCSQVVRARALDYLFTSTGDDVRTTWVNPAGLAAALEASIFAEVVFERPETADLRLSQWSAGFNARGVSFAYLRDRLLVDSTSHAFRAAAARPFTRGAFGVAVTFYRGDDTERGFDAGLRYRLARVLDLGLAVRNVGRPVVRARQLPLTGLVGLAWHPLGGLFNLAGEAAALDGSGIAGLEFVYRAGLSVALGTRLPVSGFVVGTLDERLGIQAWALGASVGGDRRAVALATFEDSGTFDRDQWSLTALATNRLGLRPSPL